MFPQESIRKPEQTLDFLCANPQFIWKPHRPNCIEYPNTSSKRSIFVVFHRERGSLYFTENPGSSDIAYSLPSGDLRRLQGLSFSSRSAFSTMIWAKGKISKSQYQSRFTFGVRGLSPLLEPNENICKVIHISTVENTYFSLEIKLDYCTLFDDQKLLTMKAATIRAVYAP